MQQQENKSMFNILLAIQIIVAISMVGLILIQHGQGADAGASFGAGASGTVFGAAGSGNFLTRATAVLTAIFFITSMALAIQVKQQSKDQRRLDVDENPVVETVTDTEIVTETTAEQPTEAPSE